MDNDCSGNSFPSKVAEKEVIEIRLDNVIVNKYFILMLF